MDLCTKFIEILTLAESNEYYEDNIYRMIPISQSENKLMRIFKESFNWENKAEMKYRYIKMKIPNYGIIPEGKQGAGHKAWTFIDEIIVK